MKINFPKVVKKNSKSTSDGNADNSSVSSRITNETVAEHREKILAGGRRFKYPVQYQRHKLVINTVVIGFVALTLALVLGWQQLYVAQNTSKFMYRVSQVVPYPVASVDGEWVRFSDYLRKLRSNIQALLQQKQIIPDSADGRRQVEYYKVREIVGVEQDAYARKLARGRGITVSSQEVNDFIKKTVDAKSVSLSAYEKTVLNTFYDWSLSEYKTVIRDQLLKRKVSFAVDEPARKRVDEIQDKIKNGEDFGVLASQLSDDDITKAASGDVGVLSKTTPDINGTIAVAEKLEAGQVSNPIEGSDGYYIIKVIGNTSERVHYAQIKIKLTEFNRLFAQLEKDGKVKEYIKIDKNLLKQQTN